ncbi:GGDEF domain-containing protein [Mesobacillus foraminis]|uniref:Diguanylate cyclase n=1 Tax=Mesobacillus foraminis TaxID=279826 RepID=A0A4V2RDU6_9BACI|nr:diguanylate cyclase [Mesobacillus foraminis]TCN26130.1 diguanylate cyclase [Mesobacillus foraminis]
MHEIADLFLANMTLIISFMYIILKFKEFLIIKIKNINKYIWLVPLLISILSIWVMHHPLVYEGMRIDLRGVPLFFLSYLGGWKLGFLGLLLPVWYRIELGGPTLIQGILQGILIPYLSGALFHKKSVYNPPYTLLSLKPMMAGFFIQEIIKSGLMLLTTPATPLSIGLMIMFEAIALLSIALINNDTNRNLLTKKDLEFQSRYDNMTNLYNLRYFKNKVHSLISNKKSFVIAMCDVDHFKHYNDTNGHPAGDTVLRTIGQLLTDSMRTEDVFARYGGEEFIICFTNVTSPQTAAGIAERFRNLVETYPFAEEEKQPNGSLTISIGLSSVSHEKSLDTLIEEADQALYTSKRTGKNSIHLYHPEGHF